MIFEGFLFLFFCFCFDLISTTSLTTLVPEAQKDNVLYSSYSVTVL
jgi:hypothetical protein